MKSTNKRKTNKPESKHHAKKNKINEQNKDLSNDNCEIIDLIEELPITKNNKNAKSKVNSPKKVQLDKKNENHYNSKKGANKHEASKKTKKHKKNINIADNSKSKSSWLESTILQSASGNIGTENNERLKKLKKGAVIEITLFNWMVFSGPIKLKASEGINLIAAANASGKSSIVCALVFGLGYNSSILSRNKELINFIKKGEKKSFIEIILKYDETRNVCVKRIMNINDNKVESIWLVNNIKTNFTNILDIQKEYNLNLDNLITFMPQENVSKFSRLNPEELFEYTLLAIDSNLLKTYKDLNDIINTKQIGEKTLVIYEHEIVEEEQLMSNLEEKKGRFDELKNLIYTVKLYKVKKHMIILEKKRESLKQYKVTIDQLSKDKDKQFKVVRKYLKEIEKCHRIINKLSLKVNQKKNEIKEAISKYVMWNIKLEELEQGIVKEEKIMEDTVKNLYNNSYYVKDIDNQIKKTKREIKEIETFFTEKEKNSKRTILRESELQNELKDLLNESKTNMMKKYTLQSDIELITNKIKRARNYENIQEERMLNNIDFVFRERIINYKRNIKNIVRTHNLISDDFLDDLTTKYDVTKIASQNELNNAIADELAKRDILYGPICKYIKCKNPEFDYILEFFLKKYFNSFLLIKKENQELLEALYKNHKLSVITISKETHEFCHVTSEMKKRGVICFLYELFESPEIIKHGLSNFLPLNIAFVINDDVIKNKSTDEINEFNNFMIKELSKQLKEEINSLFYFCSNNVHRYKISSYDKNIYMHTFSYIKKSCNILYSITSDVERDLDILFEKKQKYIEELTQVEQAIHELDKLKKVKNDEHNKIILERSEINIKKKKLVLLNNDLTKLQNDLNVYLKGEDIIDQKKRSITKNITLINDQKIKVCDEYFTLLKQHVKWDQELFSESRYLNQWKRYLSVIKSRNVDNEEKLKTTKNMIDAEMTNYTTCLNDIKELENIIQTKKSALTESEIQLVNEINLPLEEINKKLHECFIQQRIFPDIEKEEEKYNLIAIQIQKHKDNIENKKKDIENLKIDLQNYDKQIETMVPNWSNEVNEYIIFLNHNFQKFMNFINPDYDGKIELVKKNNKYEKCQLYVKVKFKKTSPFLSLSVSHQSGGERSLSTMIYILSIQKLTKNGFYVLDELNQGLDQVNEKKIFELLSCLSNPTLYEQHFLHQYNYKYINIDYKSKPQYFILTPQIIRNIPFKDITVHYLFNGFGVIENQFDDLLY
ncbi:structural maintenance of chromosomes protein 5, putative [Plasmodium vinckei brucechwatti]|uniref:Structural maintenance of chromosomes protein 5 n=1 Tax=Plasmodium vinckei brucechwatti TaxID=119398 RepID=A0A6V7S587_PLAVN|nr:structural maintenance of chromosomes protein 5, putative [Plasmodium vinckei brucechwatti]